MSKKKGKSMNKISMVMLLLLAHSISEPSQITKIINNSSQKVTITNQTNDEKIHVHPNETVIHFIQIPYTEAFKSPGASQKAKRLLIETSFGTYGISIPQGAYGSSSPKIFSSLFNSIPQHPTSEYHVAGTINSDGNFIVTIDESGKARLTKE